MNRSVLFIILIFFFFVSDAQEIQSDSTTKTSKDSLKNGITDTVRKKSVKRKPIQSQPQVVRQQIKVDSSSVYLQQQFSKADSTSRKLATIPKTDSSQSITKLSVPKTDTTNYSTFILTNTFISLSGHPVLMVNKIRVQFSKDPVFYIISGLLLLFGLFKVFYSKYFFNVFKVFFNTSLRQTQLTDILLQARLASLMFNILFVISSGLYLWLVLKNKGIIQSGSLLYIPFAILAVTLVYLVKYFIIKFIGWLTSYKQASNQYIFVIFLINKIIGIFLLPFIILMAFGPSEWIPSLLLSSFLLLGTLFLLRYFRTYGILQKQLSLNLFHFSLYLTGIEILPLVALYRILTGLNQLVL